jgi:hypothetical protein
MSALVDFVAEIERQKRLFEDAEDRDARAGGTLSMHGSPPGARRIWTRQDINRCKVQFGELTEEDRERYWRTETRIQKLLDRYFDPVWTIATEKGYPSSQPRFANPGSRRPITHWQALVVEEIRPMPAYLSIFRDLQRATEAHKILLLNHAESDAVERGERDFNGDWLYPWGDVEPEHTHALLQLQSHFTAQERDQYYGLAATVKLFNESKADVKSDFSRHGGRPRKWDALLRLSETKRCQKMTQDDVIIEWNSKHADEQATVSNLQDAIDNRNRRRNPRTINGLKRQL